jgi:hypothetical protein
MKRFTSVLFVCGLIVYGIQASGCGTAEEETQNGLSLKPLFTSINDEMLTKGCAFSSCHAGTNPKEAFRLNGTPDENYAALMTFSTQNKTMKRVEPGNAEESYLYLKLTGTAKKGTRMPPAGLHPDDQEAVRQWIDDGAKR